MTTATKAVHAARMAKLRKRIAKSLEAHQQKVRHEERAGITNWDILDRNKDVQNKTLRLRLAASAVDDVVESDRDADLVWRGATFGYALALYDLETLAKATLSRRKSTNALKPYQQPALTAAPVDAAMLKHGNNISAAARSLGVHRKTLGRFLARRSK